jgi:hypothetical protein
MLAAVALGLISFTIAGVLKYGPKVFARYSFRCAAHRYGRQQPKDCLMHVGKMIAGGASAQSVSLLLLLLAVAAFSAVIRRSSSAA